MTVCDSVDILHIPRVQAESPDSRFQYLYRFQHLPELHSVKHTRLHIDLNSVDLNKSTRIPSI